MPSQYAPKHFLRQVPHSLLQRYFSARGVLGDINCAGMEETDTDVEAIFTSWHALPEKTAQGIEQDFRDIHDLASAEGVQTIIEEGQYHSTDLTTELEAHAGFIDKIMHVFLSHNRIFGVACCFDHADNLNGRSWHKRKNLPKKRPDVSAEALSQLGEAIKASADHRDRPGSVNSDFRGALTVMAI